MDNSVKTIQGRTSTLLTNGVAITEYPYTKEKTGYLPSYHTQKLTK
jgi:hypothetical protein